MRGSQLLQIYRLCALWICLQWKMLTFVLLLSWSEPHHIHSCIGVKTTCCIRICRSLNIQQYLVWYTPESSDTSVNFTAVSLSSGSWTDVQPSEFMWLDFRHLFCIPVCDWSIWLLCFASLLIQIVRDCKWTYYKYFNLVQHLKFERAKIVTSITSLLRNLTTYLPCSEQVQ